MRSKSASVLVAALAAALPPPGAAGAPTEFRLLPSGVFRTADGSGRPEGIAGWRLERAQAERLIAAAATRGNDYVIDFEHQTINAKKNGQPAPAAGWFRQLEWRDDGLYVVGVRWTAQAAAMIAAGQYRYVSPVFGYDKDSGDVIALAHAGLVNYAGLDGITDLAALAASLFPAPSLQETPMKGLLIALGLAETATEAEAIAALNGIRASHNTELVALSARAPDPAQYVPVATVAALRGELETSRSALAQLQATQQAAEIETTITAALAAGKLTPALEPWARDLGKSNFAALTAYIAGAPAGIKPNETQTGGQGGKAGGHEGLSEVDLAVCSALGIAPAEFSATRAAV